MADGNVALRWARALHSLSVDAGSEDAVLADLQALDAVIAGEGGTDLLQALSSPVFGLDERKAVLADVLGRLGAQQVTLHFLSLLIDRGRFGAVRGIVRSLTQLVDERQGRIRVRVTTVEPLDAKLQAELVAAFERSTGKKVVLESALDPSLIGGLVARIGSRVYDASLRTRLEDLKHRLIHAPALPEA
ncbi:MAG: ATP synthase F1 subunit delta [Alphaproteobacteria bacterium]|nr:ATP synthase F1 subunit delta [Alphaproteobacteria bacterium]